MLKLMKYELRKMRTGLCVLLGLLVAMEALFLLKYREGGEELPAVAIILWVYGLLGTILFTLFRGPAIYSKELKQRTSYLMFMTPNSALKILLAKVLTGMLASTAFILLYGAAALLDFELARKFYGEGISFSAIFDLLFSGMTGGQMTYLIGMGVASGFASFLYMSAAIYLSETLSATILQGKKGRGGLTLLFWCVITTVIGRLNEWCWGLEQGLVPLPLLLSLALGAIGIWGSAMLLEKKVSL